MTILLYKYISFIFTDLSYILEEQQIPLMLLASYAPQIIIHNLFFKPLLALLKTIRKFILDVQRKQKHRHCVTVLAPQ